MSFVDEVVIEIEAGHGGAGAAHFRREKYVPLGGPDGGDGGNGGSVIAIADQNRHTLLDFTYQPRWRADNGAAGDKRQKSGKNGKDVTIYLPVGTQILTADKSEVLFDLNEAGMTVVLAQGGKGGKGNAFFKSATNRAPEHAQPGLPGESGTFVLSLKLVADVGIIGFPNAGKSTLISRISAAKPKIADYPFTTLTPNLGVVKPVGQETFVVADIPGLIPGAHTGKGLGIQFLKHVERTGILLHLIDAVQIDDNGESVHPLEAFEQLESELRHFSSDLATKSRIVAFSKCDALQEDAAVVEAEGEFKARGISTFRISSVSGLGIPELIQALSVAVKRWRARHN